MTETKDTPKLFVSYCWKRVGESSDKAGDVVLDFPYPTSELDLFGIKHAIGALKVHEGRGLKPADISLVYFTSL